jgi:hypothetical protein
VRKVIKKMKRKNNLRKSINESVKQFIMEFGVGDSKEAKENRKKMALASKRALDKGNDEIYHKSVLAITNGGGSKEDLVDFNNNWEKLNSQPANNLATEGRNQIKVSESQLFNIIKESVMRILQEEYTGDEPFVPNKYPGEMPNFHSKEEYRNWRSKEAPNDWFDWRDDRKCQRTGIQPGYSAFATRAMKDRRDGKMSWNSDKNYNKFQMLKQKNGIQ